MAERLIDVLVEIPRGSRNKYEFDETTGHIHLDRVLYSSVHYPTDYGFIPNTLAEDGDHLDALVVVNEPTFPGCMVRIRPIGMLVMRDEKGSDHKILGVPIGDPRLAEIRDLGQLQPHWLREIDNFFRTYKILQEVDTVVRGWEGVEAAWEEIELSLDRARRAESRSGIS